MTGVPVDGHSMTASGASLPSAGIVESRSARVHRNLRDQFTPGIMMAMIAQTRFQHSSHSCARAHRHGRQSRDRSPDRRAAAAHLLSLGSPKRVNTRPCRNPSHTPHSLQDISCPILAGYFSELSTLIYIEVWGKKMRVLSKHSGRTILGNACRNVARYCPKNVANHQSPWLSHYFWWLYILTCLFSIIYSTPFED
jgi:hypothetical protein